MLVLEDAENESAPLARRAAVAFGERISCDRFEMVCFTDGNSHPLHFVLKKKIPFYKAICKWKRGKRGAVEGRGEGISMGFVGFPASYITLLVVGRF